MASQVYDSLYFDFSLDGENWSTYPVNGFKVEAGINEFHTAVKLGRYFRPRLVNGTTPQSYLRLSTYYGDNYTPSVSPLNQSANLDQDAIFVRGTIAQDEIRIGRRTGVDGWTKWGYNDDVDTGGEEIIAPFGGTFTPMVSAETFTITYNASNDGLGQNGALELTFYKVSNIQIML